MTRRIGLARLSVVAAIAIAVVGGLALGTGRLVSAQQASVTVTDAWLRQPVGNRKTTAVFAVVENKSAEARAVVGGTTDAAEKLELHEMKMDGAMMRMSPVKEIRVPANGKTELKPGGLHIMLFGLKAQPKVGDTVNLSLRLDDGTTVVVAAQVRKMDGM